ncbi:MFS transporter [Brachybacterium fresconis]|uniref:MFS family permease n=1 Tax=Brachybacterium fresconis TaxID=173363 RepID=A0ABS4YJY5_9MICO|nr:MFS transporter [Brachybacterium fresconis]MBP2409111.1 MFS family permease [Brachybacterium fresconis]
MSTQQTTAPAPQQSSPTLRRAAGTAYFPIAFIARFPFAMMVVGTLTLVVAARDSIALGGMNAAAVGLGAAIVGPLLGAAADRIGQRTVILAAGIANSLALLAIAAVAFSSLPDAFVLLTGFLVGATSPQIGPFSRSRLVQLILTRLPAGRRARSLNATMGYESAADETAFVFGPIVVGLLATTMSPAAPMIGAAVLTLLFVTAFALHPTARISVPSADEPVAQAPARELATLGVLVVVAGALGVGLFFGTVLTSLTAFLSDSGRGDSAGLVYGVMGVGSTILALSISLFPERFRLRARWLVFSALMLASMIAFSLAGGLGGVIAAMAVAGIGIGPTIVTLYSLAAERSPQGRSATVMSMLGSATIVGQSAASALTGAVAEQDGSQASMWMPVGAAGLVVLAALVNAVGCRDGATPSAAGDDLPQGTPLLAEQADPR